MTAATMVMRMMLKRLRDVDPKVLCELKAPLTDFNARTKRWSSTANEYEPKLVGRSRGYQPHGGIDNVKPPPRAP